MPSNFAKYQIIASFLRQFCIFILSKNSIYHKNDGFPPDGIQTVLKQKNDPLKHKTRLLRLYIYDYNNSTYIQIYNLYSKA